MKKKRELLGLGAVVFVTALFLIVPLASNVIADNPEGIPKPEVWINGVKEDWDWELYYGNWSLNTSWGLWSHMNPQGIFPEYGGQGETQLVGLRNVILARLPILPNRWTFILGNFSIEFDNGFIDKNHYYECFINLPIFQQPFILFHQENIIDLSDPYNQFKDAGVKSIHTDFYFGEFVTDLQNANILWANYVYNWNVTFYDDISDTDWSNCSSACFLGGTKITMADGTFKNIEDIQIDDLVETYDIETKSKSIGKVTKTYHHEPHEMPNYYMIVNDKLCVTPNHIMYINGGLKPAAELEIGDLLGMENNIVYDIQKIYEQVPTYNFEVKPENGGLSKSQIYCVEEMMVAYPTKIVGSEIGLENAFAKIQEGNGNPGSNIKLIPKLVEFQSSGSIQYNMKWRK